MNPNWVRLIAVALTFVSFGTAVLVYIVLWLALPAAKTTAEKLQMAGKPVTLAALKESSIAGPIEPRTKPLLVLLRVVVGLGFVAAAIIPIAMLVFGVGVGVTEFNDNKDLINGWLVSAFILLVVSGVLFTLLMIMAAYSTFAWRFTKRIAFSGLGVIIAGMVLSATAFGLGAYGSSQANQKVASLTRTNTSNVTPQFDGATGIIADTGSLVVEYQQTEGAPRIELTTTDRGNGRPSIDVVRDGENVRLTTTGHDDATSCLIPGGCGYGTTRAVVYGPALKNIELQKGHLMYSGKPQVDMTVAVKNGAKLSLSDTVVTNLTATVDQNGSLSTDGSSIENVVLQTQSGGSVAMGVVSNLDFTVPSSCPAGSKTDISVEQVTTLKQAGQVIPKQAEIDVSCAEITINAMDEDSGRWDRT
ncbi:MAG: PspC domain-containing protein [Chloroflexi bacterium]|nr:MAG: PspC domain-containing protein [Chloroflexota bacterium]